MDSPNFAVIPPNPMAFAPIGEGAPNEDCCCVADPNVEVDPNAADPPKPPPPNDEVMPNELPMPPNPLEPGGVENAVFPPAPNNAFATLPPPPNRAAPPPLPPLLGVPNRFVGRCSCVCGVLSPNPLGVVSIPWRRCRPNPSPSESSSELDPSPCPMRSTVPILSATFEEGSVIFDAAAWNRDALPPPLPAVMPPKD